MEHIVYTQVYLDDMQKFEQMNGIYAQSRGRGGGVVGPSRRWLRMLFGQFGQNSLY
jgi:enamine deaminase RidA (YjgF/YER057c/UK114 family)